MISISCGKVRKALVLSLVLALNLRGALSTAEKCKGLEWFTMGLRLTTANGNKLIMLMNQTTTSTDYMFTGVQVYMKDAQWMRWPLVYLALCQTRHAGHRCSRRNGPGNLNFEMLQTRCRSEKQAEAHCSNLKPHITRLRIESITSPSYHTHLALILSPSPSSAEPWSRITPPSRCSRPPFHNQQSPRSPNNFFVSLTSTNSNYLKCQYRRITPQECNAFPTLSAPFVKKITVLMTCNLSQSIANNRISFAVRRFVSSACLLRNPSVLISLIPPSLLPRLFSKPTNPSRQNQQNNQGMEAS